MNPVQYHQNYFIKTNPIMYRIKSKGLTFFNKRTLNLAQIYQISSNLRCHLFKIHSNFSWWLQDTVRCMLISEMLKWKEMCILQNHWNISNYIYHHSNTDDLFSNQDTSLIPKKDSDCKVLPLLLLPGKLPFIFLKFLICNLS